MSWKSKYSSAGGGAGKSDGLFVKLEDGESLEFVVPEDSVPHEKYIRWADGVSEACSPGDEGAKPRIALAVYDPQAGKSRILEMATGTFQDLCKCIDHARVGGLGQIYEISREGKGMKTRWKVSRIDKAADDTVKAANRAEQPDLERWGFSPLSETVDRATEPEEREAQERRAAKKAAAKAQPEPAVDEDVPF